MFPVTLRKFITDRRAEELPTLEPLSPEDRQQALRDAEGLWEFIRRSEVQRGDDWVPEDALQEWANGANVDPDGLQAALGVLLDTNRVLQIGVPDPQPVADEQTEEPGHVQAQPDSPPADSGIPPESGQAETHEPAKRRSSSRRKGGKS